MRKRGKNTAIVHAVRLIQPGPIRMAMHNTVTPSCVNLEGPQDTLRTSYQTNSGKPKIFGEECTRVNLRCVDLDAQCDETARAYVRAYCCVKPIGPVGFGTSVSLAAMTG